MEGAQGSQQPPPEFSDISDGSKDVDLSDRKFCGMLVGRTVGAKASFRTVDENGRLAWPTEKQWSLFGGRINFSTGSKKYLIRQNDYESILYRKEMAKPYSGEKLEATYKHKLFLLPKLDKCRKLFLIKEGEGACFESDDVKLDSFLNSGKFTLTVSGITIKGNPRVLTVKSVKEGHEKWLKIKPDIHSNMGEEKEKTYHFSIAMNDKKMAALRDLANSENEAEMLRFSLRGSEN